VAGLPTGTEKSTVCACDCESHCRDVADHYVKEHLRFPAWFGGKGTPIEVDFVGSECFYMPDGGKEPCNWGCRVEYKRRDNGSKVTVGVTLMNSQRFYAGTADPAFPLCAYNFECEPLTLSEIGCQERIKTTTPPAQTVYYVQSGDWLAKIASDHGVTLGALQQANPQLGPPYRSWSDIYPGDAVNIPA